MNSPFSFSSLVFSVVVIPVLALGGVSCASMEETGGRLAEWKEKREEKRLAREVALAEKTLAEEEANGGRAVAKNQMEESIFLNYASPGGSLLDGALADMDGGYAGGYSGGGPALPGAELPMVLDVDGMGWGADDGIFLAESGSDTLGWGGAVPVDADMVRAWAASISPIMGASLTEPLITAAMTAHLNPTESAVAAHVAETDATPLAHAFAGQPSRPTARRLTSELEHE